MRVSYCPPPTDRLEISTDETSTEGGDRGGVSSIEWIGKSENQKHQNRRYDAQATGFRINRLE